LVMALVQVVLLPPCKLRATAAVATVVVQAVVQLSPYKLLVAAATVAGMVVAGQVALPSRCRLRATTIWAVGLVAAVAGTTIWGTGTTLSGTSLQVVASEVALLAATLGTIPSAISPQAEVNLLAAVAVSSGITPSGINLLVVANLRVMAVVAVASSGTIQSATSSLQVAAVRLLMVAVEFGTTPNVINLQAVAAAVSLMVVPLSGRQTTAARVPLVCPRLLVQATRTNRRWAVVLRTGTLACQTLRVVVRRAARRAMAIRGSLGRALASRLANGDSQTTTGRQKFSNGGRLQQTTGSSTLMRIMLNTSVSETPLEGNRISRISSGRTTCDHPECPQMLQ